MKGQSIFGWYSNYTADSVISYAHVYVPRPDRTSLSPLFWNNLNERSQSNAAPQAACRVCTLRIRVPVQVLVPYRTAAGHHSLRIMDRSLNACKTFQINVRFMDRSLNVCKTFYNRKQCLIYGSVIECM